MKKLVFCYVLLFALLMPVKTFTQSKIRNSSDKKFHIFVNGAFNMVSEMGSESDYVAGDNDFPVTPSHSEFGGGVGFMYTLSEDISLQLSMEYLLGAEVTIEDPSDGETYNYQTYDNLNVLGSAILFLGDKRNDTRFFVTAGGGLNLLMPYDDKEQTGSLGSVIIIQAPETTTNIMIALGGGAFFNLEDLFIKVDLQYSMVLDYGKNSILIRLGVGF